MELIRHVAFALKGLERHFARALLLHFAHAVMLTAPGILIVAILSQLLAPDPDTTAIWQVVAFMAALFIAQLFVAWAANLTNHHLTYRMSESLRMKLGGHLYKVSLGVFSRHEPSELSSLISQDVRVVEALFSHAVTNLAASLFSVLILLTFLFWLDSWLASILVIGIALLLPFLAASDRLVHWLGKAHMKLRGELATSLLEFYLGMKYLKAFNLAGIRFESLRNKLNDYRRSSYRTEMLPGPLVFIAFVFCDFAYLAMIWIALGRFADGELSLLILLTFLIIGYLAFDPLKALLIDVLHMRYVSQSLARIERMLKVPSIDNGTLTERPSRFDVAFEDVTFGYQNTRVLKDLRLHFKQGKITALVGYSGSGKSTVMNLIARFYDVQKGRITIGGTDIRDLKLHTLYDCMSEVFQDVYLFDDTIANNVRIGKPNATDEEVMQACEQAQCGDFLERFSNGIHTAVGEGGAKLSGGEKQRVAIARALLKDAPILLLDEATASLDPENELSIQRAIQALTRNKTVIVIAHTLSTIQSVDKIIILDQGIVREQGTHAELVVQNGIYAQMWKLQQENIKWSIT